MTMSRTEASYQLAKTPGIWPNLVIRHPRRGGEWRYQYVAGVLKPA
jgi:hypothetical protein